jgi:hypothetical protein
MTDVTALKLALLEGKVTVDFTKVNGARRTMVATLFPDFLPPPHPEKDNKTKDPNLLIVFDTEHQGWRTIKAESILDWAPGENSLVQAQPEAPVIGNWSPIIPA